MLPVFEASYLQTFNRPNVTLVDAKAKGVKRINVNGFYGGGSLEFFKILEGLCAAGDLPGSHLLRLPAPRFASRGLRAMIE